MDYFKEARTFDDINKRVAWTKENGEGKYFSLLDLKDWLQGKIDYDMKLLNENKPVTTDEGTDITPHIAGRLQAYIEVKAYIERGIKGQKG